MPREENNTTVASRKTLIDAFDGSLKKRSELDYLNSPEVDSSQTFIILHNLLPVGLIETYSIYTTFKTCREGIMPKDGLVKVSTETEPAFQSRYTMITLDAKDGTGKIEDTLK